MITRTDVKFVTSVAGGKRHVLRIEECATGWRRHACAISGLLEKIAT
jgi:hypothetical protein